MVPPREPAGGEGEKSGSSTVVTNHSYLTMVTVVTKATMAVELWLLS